MKISKRLIDVFDIKLHEPETIVKYICEYKGVTLTKVQEADRSRDMVHVRRLLCYFLNYYTNLSLKAIATKLGYEDHTTVCYACDKIIDEMVNYEEVRMDIDVIKGYLTPSAVPSAQAAA